MQRVAACISLCERGTCMQKFRIIACGTLFAGLFLLCSQEQQLRPAAQPPRDAVQEAQRSLTPAPKRPEQSKSPHDQSDQFSAAKADPSSPVFKVSPKRERSPDSTSIAIRSMPTDHS